MTENLLDNGLVEPALGPWASQVVLAAKAKQENVPWYEYTWRLCVSYRMLNQVPRAFAYLIKRCDDTVAEIPPEAQFFITANMDAVYWEIETEEASRDRLAFFVPNGKLQWTVMPMGALNAHAVWPYSKRNGWQQQSKLVSSLRLPSDCRQHPTLGSVRARPTGVLSDRPRRIAKVPSPPPPLKLKESQ